MSETTTSFSDISLRFLYKTEFLGAKRFEAPFAPSVRQTLPNCLLNNQLITQFSWSRYSNRISVLTLNKSISEGIIIKHLTPTFLF